jgi:methylamine dehydrogenase accessory protein MauD
MLQVLIYSNVLLWLVHIVVLFCLFLLFRQFGEVYLSTAKGISNDGIPVGAKVPQWPLEPAAKVAPGPTEKTPQSVLPKRSLLVFVTPACKACDRLVSDWNRLYKLHHGSLRFIIVGVGEKEETEKWIRQRAVQGEIVYDQEQRMMTDYKVRVTPFAFMIDEQGIVLQKGLCNGEQHLLRLLDGSIDQA